jgi:hypothetical protein
MLQYTGAAEDWDLSASVKLSIEIHSQAGEYIGEVGTNKFLNVRIVSKPQQKTHGILARRQKLAMESHLCGRLSNRLSS